MNELIEVENIYPTNIRKKDIIFQIYKLFSSISLSFTTK